MAPPAAPPPAPSKVPMMPGLATRATRSPPVAQSAGTDATAAGDETDVVAGGADGRGDATAAGCFSGARRLTARVAPRAAAARRGAAGATGAGRAGSLMATGCAAAAAVGRARQAG